jgi:hypothetical protein
MKVLRLVGKVTWKGHWGLDACLWSRTGGVVRRQIEGFGGLFAPDQVPPDIPLNKYYDDSLWDDRLPENAALRGAEYLEYHDIIRKEREEARASK